MFYVFSVQGFCVKLNISHSLILCELWHFSRTCVMSTCECIVWKGWWWEEEGSRINVFCFYVCVYGSVNFSPFLLSFLFFLRTEIHFWFVLSSHENHTLKICFELCSLLRSLLLVSVVSYQTLACTYILTFSFVHLYKSSLRWFCLYTRFLPLLAF